MISSQDEEKFHEDLGAMWSDHSWCDTEAKW
jgi:hypothetical protein